jgi:hypothetical protein
MGRMSTVDLLAQTSSDQLLLILNMRRSTLLSLPLQFVFPGLTHPKRLNAGYKM